jgi:hypothetical protein
VRHFPEKGQFLAYMGNSLCSKIPYLAGNAGLNQSASAFSATLF